MAITLVQTDDAGVANATVTTINMPGAITAGNLLVATMAVRQHATTWTITGITGWSGPYSTHSERDSTTTQKNLRMWWKVAGSSESTTITFTGSALSTTAIVVSEWAGFTNPEFAAFTPTHTSAVLVASRQIQTLTPNSGAGLALLASVFRTTSPTAEASANNGYAEADEAISAGGGVLSQWLGWKEVSSTAESVTTVSWTTTAHPLLTAFVFTEAGIGVKEPYLVSAGDVLLGGYDTGTLTGALMPDAKLANDVAILSVSAQNASTFTTPSGWTEFTGTAQNDAAWSTAWFWKRLDGSETDGTSTVSTTLTSGSVAAFARIYLFRNCTTSGDPFEDVTMNGAPTLSTTPTSSAIDTTGPRLAVALAAIEDNNTVTNSPPSGWVGVGYQISAAGSDGSMDGIWQVVPSAQSVAAVALHTQSAAESWRTMTLALIAPTVGGGTNYTETGLAINIVSTVTGDSQADFEEPVGLVTVTSTLTGTDQADLKDLGLLSSVTVTVTATDTLGADIPPLIQEGYRWRNDDGSQTTATWKAAQDTNVTLNIGEAARLRVLLDTTDDPDPYAYTLYYKKSTDSTWVPVPVGSGGGSPVYIATSTNVTASGEVTTAQLTPPAGKTTAAFTTGRMWDDENGTDSVDI